MQEGCLKSFICYTLAHWGFRYSRFSRHEDRKGKCDIERNSWREQRKRLKSSLQPISAAQRNSASRPACSHNLSAQPALSLHQGISHLMASGSLGLSKLLFLDAASGAGRRSAAHLLELVLLVLGREGRCTVQALVELDDFRVNGFELGLVEVVAGSGAEAVGAATRVCRVVGVVLELGEADWAPEVKV
jgi:hypothetical protein